MVVDLSLLERLQAEFGLVLASYVPAHRVVPGEGARTERTRHPDALVPLPYVRPQVGLVSVQPFAERTLQFFTCKWRKFGDYMDLSKVMVTNSLFFFGSPILF